MVSCTQKQGENDTDRSSISNVSYVFYNPPKEGSAFLNLKQPKLLKNDLALNTDDPCMSGDAYTSSYQLNINTCSSSSIPTLSLNEIFYFGGATPPSYLSVSLNGFLFPATYVSTDPISGLHKFSLLNISFSSIGVSNYCSRNGTIDVEYFSCGILEPSSTLQILDFVTANACSYSISCIATSNSAGTLNLIYPTSVCAECNSSRPATLEIRYKKVSESSWTYISSNYPAYLSNVTITSLTPGTYNVETRNTCSSTSGPWTPVVGGTIVVS